jgi:hypothetical protein
MWLVTKEGLFSIVHKDCKQDEVMVRSRVRVDLENLLKKIYSKAKIIEGAGTDYQFRCIVPRDDLAEYLVEYVTMMDYGNFKNTIPDNDRIRHSAYYGIWSSGAALRDGSESTFWP